MTLVALLALTTQAWAVDDLSNKIWKPGDTFNIGAAWLYDGDTSTETVFHSINEDNTVPAINDWTYDSNSNQWKTPGFIKVDKVDSDGDVISLDYSILLALSAPEGKLSADVKPIGFKIISGAGTKESPYTLGLVYEEAPASAVEVEWDAATKTGTFSMPASDVVLTPIYAEATISRVEGTTETETAFASLKEAFQNVQSGDVIKLDWNVTLTETLETPTIDGGVKFTLDFNGYTLDCGTTYQIKLKNTGDQLTFTDSSDDQLGGLIAQTFNVESGSELVFDAGRYNFSETTAELLNAFCAESRIPFSLEYGKEFIDLEGGANANDGFCVYVDWKVFELAIGAGKFETFYAGENVKLIEGEGISFYTIGSISEERTEAVVTEINSTVIPEGTPILVYNGGDQKQTVKLIATPETVNLSIDVAPEFKGTAVPHEFSATDMEAADYYALSGGVAFAKVKGAGTLKANKCWLQFDKDDQAHGARSINIVFADETTGVSEQLRVNSEEFAPATYTIDGRKVTAPTKKGVYIQNGRKVVVK